MATKPTRIPRTGMISGGMFMMRLLRWPLGAPSLVDLERVDLQRQLRRLVGDNPLQGFQPVLDGAELCTKLRVFLREQFDPLGRLAVSLGMNRLAPRAIERIAVLDPHPVVEQPAGDSHRNDYGDRRKDAAD